MPRRAFSSSGFFPRTIRAVHSDPPVDVSSGTAFFNASSNLVANLEMSEMTSTNAGGTWISFPLALMGINGSLGCCGGSNGSRTTIRYANAKADENQAISNSSMNARQRGGKRSCSKARRVSYMPTRGWPIGPTSEGSGSLDWQHGSEPLWERVENKAKDNEKRKSIGV